MHAGPVYGNAAGEDTAVSPYRDLDNDIGNPISSLDEMRLKRETDSYQEDIELRQRWHRNIVTALYIIGIVGMYLVPIALAWAFTQVTP